MKHLISVLVLMGAGASVACQNTDKSYEVTEEATVSLNITGMT